jgi:hypothetical protein
MFTRKRPGLKKIFSLMLLLVFSLTQASVAGCTSLEECAVVISEKIEANLKTNHDNLVLEGTVYINLKADFSIESLVIVKSSGNNIFDADILKAVEASGPFNEFHSMTESDKIKMREIQIRISNKK